MIHRIPPKPGYVRVKIWRRLTNVGALAIRQSVYVLPRNDQTHEDFKWAAQEIQKIGGEVTICEARFIDGLTDPQIERMFMAERDAEYAALTTEINGVLASLPGAAAMAADVASGVESEILRFRRRLASLARIDYFGAPGRAHADAALTRLETRMRGPSTAPGEPAADGSYEDRVWVTRAGLHVDRIASAWLIQRRIDPRATFKFIDQKAYRHEDGELRFDMFEGEFTHEGDLCTFEVLVERFRLEDPALRAIAEIIHDIDLKESKFGRPETAGFERLIAGIAVAHQDDRVRLDRGSAILDDLYEAFRRYSR